MGSINSSAYLVFLDSLREVYKEANVSLQQEKELDGYKDQNVREAIAHLPPFSVEGVAEKVKSYVEKGELLIYEAAKRAELKELADFSLRAWQARLNKKLENKFSKDFPSSGGATSSSLSLDGFEQRQAWLTKDQVKELDEKLDKIISKMQWPQFRDSSQREVEIGKGLTCLAKDIVFRKFHKDEALKQIPAHVNPLIRLSSPNLQEQYLIGKYTYMQKEISFAKEFKATFTDQDIQMYLRRFNQAEVIDLSHCLKLTPKCLEGGHQTIKKIILTGTCIQVSDVPKSQFPCLEAIEQEKKVAIFNLEELINYHYQSYLSSTIDWSAIKAKAEGADIILCSSCNAFYTLIEKFEKEPSMAGLEALLALRLNRSKFQIGSIWSEDIEARLGQALVLLWKRVPGKEWSNSESFGCQLLQKMFDLWAVGNQDTILSLTISDAFWMALTVTKKVNTIWGKEREDTDYLSNDSLDRIRYLIKALHNYDWSAFQRLANAIAGHIETINTTLLSKERELFYFSLKGQEPDVMKKALLEEIYVEVTQHLENAAADCFITSSLDYKRQGTTNLCTLQYRQTMSHSLACAFALKLNLNAREKLLKHIMENFSSYTNDGFYYPLSKMILGLIEAKDIPQWDAEGSLRHYLCSYQGVFEEKISQDLKEALWAALCQGKLGGKTPALVDTLVAFYHKKADAKEWQKKVMDALEQLSGNNGAASAASSNNNSLASYALKKLQQLKRERIAAN